MSEKSGQNAKPKDGRKYATLSLFNTYKGKSLETQKSTVAARHGLQSLGKVAVSRRMPPPANLPSIKKEHKGNDPNVSLVPKDGSGWASKQDQPEEEIPPEVPPSPPPPPKPLIPVPPEVPTVVKSWASTKPGGKGDGVQLNRNFQQEFPTLKAAGDQPKENDATVEVPGSNAEGKTGPEDGATEAQETPGSLAEKLLPGAVPLKLNEQQPGPAPQYRGLMPPFAGNMFQSFPRMPFPQLQQPHRYPTPSEASRGPRGRHPPQPQSWAAEGVERPSIVKANELKELDNLDTEADEGWAGAQSEVDYSEQLNFSDDEEGGVPRERGESGLNGDQNVTKREHAQSKAPESSEGQKEAVERPAPRKWAELPPIQAPSQPPSAKGPLARSAQPQNQLPPPPSRLAGQGRPAAFAPKPDEDEVWKQRKRQPGEVSASVERARKRREEEERRMEEQRKAACAEKLKRLNEKFGIVEKPTVEKALPVAEPGWRAPSDLELVEKVHQETDQMEKSPQETVQVDKPPLEATPIERELQEAAPVCPESELERAPQAEPVEKMSQETEIVELSSLEAEPGEKIFQETRSVEEIALYIEAVERVPQSDPVENLCQETEPVEETCQKQESVTKPSPEAMPVEKVAHEDKSINKSPLEAVSSEQVAEKSTLLQEAVPLESLTQVTFLLQNIPQETPSLENLSQVPSPLEHLPLEAMLHEKLPRESVSLDDMPQEITQVENLPEEPLFVRPPLDVLPPERPPLDVLPPERLHQDRTLPERLPPQDMALPPQDMALPERLLHQDFTLPDRRLQDMTLLERPRQDLTLPERLLQDTMLPDRQRRDMALSDRPRRDMAPTDRLRRDMAPDRTRRDMAPLDWSRRDMPPSDRLRRDMPPSDRLRRDMPPSDRLRRDMPPSDRLRRDMLPSDRLRRDMPPSDRPRRDMVSLDRPRREMALPDRSRQESFLERPYREQFDRTHQEMFRETPPRDAFPERQSHERPSQVTMPREKPPQDTSMERQPQGMTPQERPPRVTTPQERPPRVTTPQERPPRVTTPQERPPRVTTPQERPPRVTTPQERPPRLMTPQERPPRVTTPQERPPLVTTPQERPQQASLPLENLPRDTLQTMSQQRLQAKEEPREALTHRKSEEKVGESEIYINEDACCDSGAHQIFTGQDSGCSEKETSSLVAPAPPTASEDEQESGSQPRPAVSSGYSKQFQKSLPPRFQRQQEQMKQQQWQQQQQGALSQPSQAQPASGPVPPRQHRPLYQPLAPHPQHLASMGFDPRWLMMQPYMDPRMMSGRPAMDMPPMHPGMMPPKQLMRRDQIEGSGSSAESFEHMPRSVREHGLPLPEARMMWGSEPYPHSEPQQAATPPKMLEELDMRPDTPLEQEGTTSYVLEHSQLESRHGADFITDQRETDAHKFAKRHSEAAPLLQTDEPSPATLVLEATEKHVAPVRTQEEIVPIEASQPSMLRRASLGSNQSLKSDEQRTETQPSAVKVISRPVETKEVLERAEEKPKRDGYTGTKSSEGPKTEKYYKSRHDTRWGPRPGPNRREEGCERPVRRSGPIKKPVLRDMKEERELRREKEGEKLAYEKGGKSEKVERKEPPPLPKPELEKPSSENTTQDKQVTQNAAPPSEKMEAVPEPADKPPSLPLSAVAEVIKEEKTERPERTVVAQVTNEEKNERPERTVVAQVAKEEKTERPDRLERSVSKEAATEKPHLDSRLPPPRREPGLPLRTFRKDARERDWFPDQGYRGRGRGEYYSRGRSYRGSYGGRGRGGRGQGRDYPLYRDPKPRSENLPMGAPRQREESETRSESSDFEVVPKRRRQRGSETDSDSDGRESASDTPLSDKESVSKSKPLKRDERADAMKAPKPLLEFRPESAARSDIRPRERQYIREDEITKPGFLPKGEPMRRGRGGMYRRGGRESGGRPPRPPPLRRPVYRDNQWIPRQQDGRQIDHRHMEPYRCDDAEPRHYDHMAPVDQRPPPKFERPFDPARDRPRRQRPARPPRQDKPPRFRRLKEREDATKIDGVSGTGAGTGSQEQQFPDMSGKTSDLSNQNSSDQANEEWETASESSDFNERRERDERKAAASAQAAAAKSGESAATAAPKRDISKRSFSSQRPGVDRQNRRGNSGPARAGRNFSGPRGDRRNGPPMPRGKRGPFEDQIPGMTGIDPNSSYAMNHHYYHHNYHHNYPEEAGSMTVVQKSPKDPAVKKKEEPKPAPKKPKEKVDALSQFDLNNYASVVIIDDHPEVTTLEDSQSNLNDDGFTEVVSKKQQKRLQDEERRKKEEQSVQVWNKKGSTEKGRGPSSKLPPRFVKKQQQAVALDQSPPPPPPPPQVPNLPQASSPSQTTTQPPAAANSTDSLATSKPVPSSQAPSNLGTEVWENKMASPPVLNDPPKKMAPVSLPQAPPGGAWNKSLASYVPSGSPEGTSAGQESGLELGIDTIQFGAPACSGMEDEVISMPSEKATETVPEPKEQRQKQPRAGPIKAQKLPDLSLPENKEHKPGPIGKERSLKNRKVKDGPAAEPEAQDMPSPIAVRTPDPVVVKETKVELTPEIGTISVPTPDFGASAKETVTDYTAPSNPLTGKVAAAGPAKLEETLVTNVPLSHTLPLPRRETLQQSSSLTPASPATVDLTLKMESARKAWENSPSLAETTSPVTSTAPPITSVSVSISSGGGSGGGVGVGGVGNSISSGCIVISSGAPGGNSGGPVASGGTYVSFSSTSMPPIPVASITPTTSSGAGTYTTASLSTKATVASDPPNICKVKPQQLQSSTMPSAGHFSQLSCMPSLIAQQQQSPQVYVSQSAAGPGAQIPAFYMDTSHLFSTQHARLGPPSLAQQQGFQPGLSQIPIPIYAPMQGQHQGQLSLGAGPSVSQAQEMFPGSLQPYRSQPAFMQNNLSQPSQMVLSGPTLHNFPGVQHQDLAKAQSSMTYQQASNTQPIPILYEHQLSQSGLGGSQLMDTHLLQARQSMGQPSNLYSGQAQQPTQTNYYSTAQSPSALQQWRYLSQVRAGPELTSAPDRKWLSQSMPAEFVCLQTGRTDADATLPSVSQSCKNGVQGLFFNPYQKMAVPMQGSQLSLANFGSTAGQPLIALPQSLQPSPQAQHQSISRSVQANQTYRGLMPTSSQHGMMTPSGKMTEMDLKPYGSGMDHVKPGTPPIGGRSTTPTSSPFRASSTSPNSQSGKMNSMVYQKHQFTSTAGGVRMGQPFPGQFPPQMLPQPSLVPPMVRGPHANTYPAPVQRPPMQLPSQMPPPMTPGLMNHPRLHHVARGPPGPPSGARASPAHPSMKAEQDLKAKQRAEVLQSTQRFFSEQLNKPPASKPLKADIAEARPPETLPNPPIVVQEKAEEKPTPALPAAPAKPIRTGPIKPQAIKPEETKS